LAAVGPEWRLAKALDLTCVAPVALRPKLQDLVESAGAKLWSFVAGRGDTATPPVVVLVPGIMGSELAIGSERVWLSPWRLAQGMFDRLRLPASDPARAAVAVDLLCAGYRATLDRLARQYQVVTFPYDWRDDVERAAARLRELLDALVDDPDTGGVAVHVVAHSMGGW
jgi:pimeloyl-ACP methyl ester carboxylesterase